MDSISRRYVLVFFSVTLLLLADFSSASSARQICVPPPSDIIGWWPGDGNAADTIAGNHGSLHNGATFASGLIDQAFSFDGVDDVIGTPLIISYPGGTTFEVWIRTTDEDGVFMAGGGGSTPQRGMALSIEPYNGQSFLIGGQIALFGTRDIPDSLNFLIAGPRVNDGEFHHVVATWTGDASEGGVNLYVDGNLVGTATALQAVGTDSAAMNFGGHTVIPYRKFVGLIDEVTIYGRVLSYAEVQAIFVAGSAGKCKFRLPFVGPEDITNGPTCGKHKDFTEEAIDYGLFYESVYATEDGDVVFAGSVPPGPKPNLSGFGKFIVIQHDDGSRSYYAHLSQALVTSGRVTKGQLIAVSGESGKAEGPHLHFQIMDSQGVPIPIRTLPVTTWISGDPNYPCQKKGEDDGSAVGPPVP